MRRASALLLALLAPAAAAQPFFIDGKFDDWPAEPAAVSDPTGDATGQLDAVSLAGVLTGNTLQIALTITEPQNLQSGSQTAPDLKLVIDPGTGPVVEIGFRDRVVVRRDTGATLPWPAVRYSSAPTVAAERFEIRVDLSAVGGVPDHAVTVWLDGSDTLVEPLALQESSRSGPPTPAIAPPLQKRNLRIASQNTLRTGLFVPAQAAPLARLLVAAEADIYLLQEEYNSSETQVANLFNSIIPLGKGVQWHAHKRGDTAVVSRWPLQPLPNYDTSYSATAVLAPDGPLIVISQHPKCCGYIGSTEDIRRIEQAALTAQVVDEARAGKFGPELVGAPVIIGGDWNLVGSRGPLDRLTAPELPGVAELTIPNRSATDVTTWRELNGLGFPPGRLDLIVYDEEHLEPIRAEVFDSEALTPERLEELGLQATDSRASDHLLLIADFFRAPKP